MSFPLTKDHPSFNTTFSLFFFLRSSLSHLHGNEILAEELPSFENFFFPPDTLTSFPSSSHLSSIPFNREGRWGTTDGFPTSFLHFSLFSTALWDLAELQACPLPDAVFPSYLYVKVPSYLHVYEPSLVLLYPGKHLKTTYTGRPAVVAVINLPR